MEVLDGDSNTVLFVNGKGGVLKTLRPLTWRGMPPRAAGMCW